MKVNVNFDLCESNAICMGIAPEVFEVREDNFLYILDENPPEALRPQMEQAVASCPRAAITLEDGRVSWIFETRPRTDPPPLAASAPALKDLRTRSEECR